MGPRRDNNKQTDKPVGEMSQSELVSLINEALKPLKEVVCNLQKEVADLRTEVETLTSSIDDKEEVIDELRTQLEEREQYSRRNNLRIFGLKESVNENTDDLVMEVATKLNVDIDRNFIDRSHRVGKPGGKPRAVIVKFVGYAPRSKLYRSKKSLKGTGITIHEDLTKPRLNLLKRAIECYTEKSVWTHDGVIMIKIGEARPFRVRSEKELDSLMERHPPN